MASEQYSTLELCREATASRTRIAALEAQLVKANTDTEKFEREWYLRGDRIEDLEAQLAALQWKLIDEEHLPTDDDELGGYNDGDGKWLVGWFHEYHGVRDVPERLVRELRSFDWTHYRPHNAPRSKP